jgi:Helix-turn-helix domain
MAKELVTMSAKEIDRAEMVRRVLEKRLTQAKAAGLLGMSVRQVKRLCRLYRSQGAAGLASRQRGRPSNRKLGAELQAHAVAARA